MVIANRSQRVVIIGGGHGLSHLLRGLKRLPFDLTAVVATSDDGGSSGRLRQQFGTLPPGDLRNCLLALSDADPLLQRLFDHRFDADNGGELGGHSLGNLMLLAMAQRQGGGVLTMLEQASQLLQVRGRVLPVTLEPGNLWAEMADGSTIEGETSIASSPLAIRKVGLASEHHAPTVGVLEAIQQADVILLGPGSLYTSVLPPLLVSGVANAIRSSSARKIYVCNLMTQPGETDGYTASDHVSAMEAHLGKSLFSEVVVNTRMPNTSMLRSYQCSGAVPVQADVEKVKAMGYVPLCGAYIEEGEGIVRHHAERIGSMLSRALEPAPSCLPLLPTVSYDYAWAS